MQQTRSKATVPQPDDWAKRWEAALATSIMPRRPEGEGWKATPELADEWGVSRQAVADRMLRLIRRGVMERAYGRFANVRTTYYRPVVKSETTPLPAPRSPVRGSRC